MTTTISLTELRLKLPGVMDRISKYFDRYIITKRGKPVAVMISAKDYERILETLEIQSESFMRK